MSTHGSQAPTLDDIPEREKPQNGVAGLKHAMDLNGYYGGPPRLPFTPVSMEARAEIANAFRDLKG